MSECFGLGIKLCAACKHFLCVFQVYLGEGHTLELEEVEDLSGLE